jgi:hypothetical protein
MKTITANSINTNLETNRKTLFSRNITAREGILMNLFSNIMIKDNDIKRSTVDNRQTNTDQDYGFNLYKTLEFSKDNTIKTNHNLQMELVCSRLI